MNRTITSLLALALALPVAAAAQAQTYRDSGGTVVPAGIPLAFLPNGNSASLSASASSSSVSLPYGQNILVQNVGANTAYVTLSTPSGVATSSGMYLPAGSSVILRAGGNAFLNGVTASGSTTINVNGGLGILAMAGGGSTGGGGGSVTQGTSPWIDSVNGWAGGTIGASTLQAFGATEATIGTGLVPAINAHITNGNGNLGNDVDAVAPTAAMGSPVINFNYAFDGTNWFRIRGDSNKNLLVAPQATAAGGSSLTGNIAANNTTAVVIKASAGTLYGAQLGGIGSAPAYLKIYNATSATCGSGTPVKRLIIPAASTAANGSGSNITFGPTGIAFGTGITYCVTMGIGDADTTAPAASTFFINLDWK